MRDVTRPIVSVVAPAGYGKTTLLLQWAERSGQAVAWVSLDEQDNDSKVLLGDVARALDAVRPVARPVFDALASPASSVPGSVVPRAHAYPAVKLGSRFSGERSPGSVSLVIMCPRSGRERRTGADQAGSACNDRLARIHSCVHGILCVRVVHG